MPISAEIIAECLKPQFIWDKQPVNRNKWLLAHIDRGPMFFSKYMGILVFINVAGQYKLKEREVQSFMGLEDFDFGLFKFDLKNIHEHYPKTEYQQWEKQQVETKSGLVKNLIWYKYRIKP